jgi:hypothetical protein
VKLVEEILASVAGHHVLRFAQARIYTATTLRCILFIPLCFGGITLPPAGGSVGAVYEPDADMLSF